jgi:hypothetical protein
VTTAKKAAARVCALRHPHQSTGITIEAGALLVTVLK